MSAQDLVPKTKFEKQVPYTLIGEIAEAVKASIAKCPVFPSPRYMQIERIWDAADKLESAGMEATYAEANEGADPVDTRPYALAIIAETIRYIQTLPKP